jgi:hypothetical protein
MGEKNLGTETTSSIGGGAGQQSRQYKFIRAQLLDQDTVATTIVS